MSNIISIQCDIVAMSSSLIAYTVKSDVGVPEFDKFNQTQQNNKYIEILNEFMLKTIPDDLKKTETGLYILKNRHLYSLQMHEPIVSTQH